MKIALFVHCFFPEHFYGTETYTLEVGRNLLQMGHEPVIVSAVFRGEPRRQGIVTRYEHDGVPVVCIDKNYLPHQGIQDTYYHLAMREVLHEILSELRPQLAHVTHLGNHTAVLLDVLDAKSIPAVATLTDFFGFCFTSRLEDASGKLCAGPDTLRINCITCALKETAQNHPRKFPYHWLRQPHVASLAAALMRFVHPGSLNEIVTDLVQRPKILAERYARYRAVIAPTKFLASAYLVNGLRAPMHVMRFGVDTPREPKRRTVTDEKLRFGFIGQLASHKGPDILVDAFGRIPQNSAELDIFGSGREGDRYFDELIRSAVGRPIRFRGTFDPREIGNILAQLDFLVIPSRWYENSPLVLLNALASHTPVIVSEVEGMTEFVEHGRNGFVFRRGSVNALERVLQDLVRDPERARSMSANTGYERTTRQMTEELIEIYTAAVGSFGAVHR